MKDSPIVVAEPEAEVHIETEAKVDEEVINEVDKAE